MLKRIRVYLMVAAVAATAGLGARVIAPAPLSAYAEGGDGGDGEYAPVGDLYEKTGAETRYVCICATTPDCEPCASANH